MTEACREGRRRVLGEDNHDYLWSSFELARIRAMQRRFAEAETLFEEVVEGQRRIFGPDHRITLPMVDDPRARSLNLATAVCAAVYEALRQFDSPTPAKAPAPDPPSADASGTGWSGSSP